MPPSFAENGERRVLILARTHEEGEALRTALARAEVSTDVCADLDDLCGQLARGAAAAIVAEEALEGAALARLELWLSQQPTWADFPVIVLAGEKDAEESLRRLRGLTSLEHATLLERPLQQLTLVSVVRAVTRSRRRQLELRSSLQEHSRAEQALRESERRFRSLADTAPVLIWISGADKHMQWVNRPWLEMTGRTLDQELGTGWTENVHPEDLPGCLETYGRSFDARKPFTMEYRLRRHDGAYRWILDNGVPMHGPDGSFQGYIGSCVDITDRKDAETSVREASQRKDQMLAMLAHELRNPLAPIRNALQVLRLPMISHETHQQMQEMIERQVRHMARLIDDLLDVTRITRGKIIVRHDRLDLARLVEVAAEDHRHALEAGGLRLEVAVPARPVWIKGDATRLTQVLDNLLTNAGKFTPRGGVVRVGLEVGSEHRSRITVRDTGIGIEPETLPFVFDVFAQAEQSLDRSRGGLGMGLTLVKGLVELHQGTVKAFSKGAGEGTEMVVELPTEQEPPALSGPPPEASPPGKGRVVVVEDHQDAAESLRMLLQLSGYEVTVANTGTEGLQLVRRIRPRIVLCDIGLPGMDGYSVATSLRGDPALADTRLIAVTGYGQAEDRRKAFEVGFDDHLVKPVDPEELLEKVRAGCQGDEGFGPEGAENDG